MNDILGYITDVLQTLLNELRRSKVQQNAPLLGSMLNSMRNMIRLSS